VLQVAPPHCLPERYFLPLGFATVPREERPTPFCIADAQLFGTGGILLDATADDEFVRTVLSTIVDAAAAVRVSPDLVVHRTFTPLGLERELQTADIRRGDAEQSNTSIILGHIAMLKLIRKLHHGVHPEPEVGYFLSEVAKI
jgi:maltose alpha-D-glucosyltransferase/alpha-amylase